MDIPQTEARVARQSAGRISYEEYLQLELDAWTEWVDGKIIYLPMASANHQRILVFLTALLPHFVEAHDLGEVYCEPFQMKTGPDLPGRSPDILFVARENLHRIQEQYLKGPADLVVEIVSPDSIRRDQVNKFGEYQEGGVKEYWIIDPLQEKADFFVRSEKGVFRPLPVREGKLSSHALAGLWLKPEWLWQKPLPPKLGILREWGLV